MTSAMSLRDQLLKAGLVNKSQADKAAREVLKEQRAARAQQLPKRELERIEAERKAREEAERLAAQVEKRRAQREAEERLLRELRPRQILRALGEPVRGGNHPFFHRSPDGRYAWRLYVPEHVATDLRCGRRAIAWLDDPRRPEVVLVDPETARRVEAIRPELILFRNRGPVDPDPAEQLYAPDR